MRIYVSLWRENVETENREISEWRVGASPFDCFAECEAPTLRSITFVILHCGEAESQACSEHHCPADHHLYVGENTRHECRTERNQWNFSCEDDQCCGRPDRFQRFHEENPRRCREHTVEMRGSERIFAKPRMLSSKVVRGRFSDSRRQSRRRTFARNPRFSPFVSIRCPGDTSQLLIPRLPVAGEAGPSR